MTSPWGWSPGSFIKADAEKVGEQLETIRERDGGVTPDAVVLASKPKRAPLHGHFEWNDRVAAHKHRLEQASHVIRCIRVKVPDGDEERQVRAFYRMPAEQGQRSYYVGVRQVADDKGLRSEITDMAMRDIGRLYARFEELEDIPKFKRWLKVTADLLAV